jgi:sec-independent protein translocase protein TatC
VADPKKTKRKRGKKANPDGTMTLLEHMDELRKSIFIILEVFFVAMIASYFMAPTFIKVAISMAHGYQFVQIGVAELLSQYVKVSVISGIVFTAPVIVWQIHRFASPGLKKAEDRIFLGVMLGGLFFFVLGAVFCYFVAAPLTLQFFLSLNTIDIGGLYSLKDYIGYLVSMIIAFGLVFEMPVLVGILTSIGLLKPATMVSGRRIMIVVIFIIGAAITPPDVASQMLVALPMCVLYELSNIICKIGFKYRQKHHKGNDEDKEADEEVIRKTRANRWAAAKAKSEDK